MRRRVSLGASISAFLLLLIFLSGCAASRVKLERPAEVTFRLVFGSCIAEPDTPLWDRLREAHPDLVLLLGDNIYLGDGELGDPLKTSLAYRRLFSNTRFRRLIEQTPVRALWDDHDFGPNNSDSTFAGAPVSLEAFKKFWFGPDYEYRTEQGIETSFLRGGIRFILSDGRSYRINRTEANRRDDATMFGEDQLSWIERLLSDPGSDVVVFASGTPLLSEQKQLEHLGAFPADQRRLLKALRNSPAKVAIISGDRHYGEILTLKSKKRTLVELSSSPLSADTRRPRTIKGDPHSRCRVTERINFGMIDFVREDDRVLIQGSLLDGDGNRICQISY